MENRQMLPHHIRNLKEEFQPAFLRKYQGMQDDSDDSFSFLKLHETVKDVIQIWEFL